MFLVLLASGTALAMLTALPDPHVKVQAYPLKPEEVGRRPQFPVVCEGDPPSGLDPISPAREPERAADPRLAAISDAAINSETEGQTCQTQRGDQTRRAWAEALGSLQQLCVDFPND
ncbi:MAG: hypothetical protein ACI9VR_003986 [Cognaticolwellia sp.]|jgi:hypothetical protein